MECKKRYHKVCGGTVVASCTCTGTGRQAWLGMGKCAGDEEVVVEREEQQPLGAGKEP